MEGEEEEGNEKVEEEDLEFVFEEDEDEDLYSDEEEGEGEDLYSEDEEAGQDLADAGDTDPP